MTIESNKSIAERREQIELMLRRERRVNVHALSEEFHVSLVTIHSDLANLERAGRLRRIRGGGFAGTIQAFVPNDMLDAFRAEMEAVLGEGSCHVLSVRSVGGTENE